MTLLTQVLIVFDLRLPPSSFFTSSTPTLHRRWACSKILFKILLAPFKNLSIFCFRLYIFSLFDISTICTILPLFSTDAEKPVCNGVSADWFDFLIHNRAKHQPLWPNSNSSSKSKYENICTLFLNSSHVTQSQMICNRNSQSQSFDIGSGSGRKEICLDLFVF